jgi:hypothetical protein
VNLAVNNGHSAYPWIDVSYAAPESPPTYLVDGNYWYHASPPNRWTTIGSPNGRDTVTVDFGVSRQIQRVSLYLLDDGAGGRVRVPSRYELSVWHSGRWIALRDEKRTPARPEGHRANVIAFAPTMTSRVRLALVPSAGAAMGMSELEVWGSPGSPTVAAAAPPRDLAFNARVSASYTAPQDHVEQMNDLEVAFTRYSRNRWTALGTPNASDWVEVDFDEPRSVRTVELYLWGDGERVKAPKSYTIQLWDGAQWRDARVVARYPARPLASARNVARLETVRTSRIRVVFEHDRPAVTGMTELVVLP